MGDGASRRCACLSSCSRHHIPRIQRTGLSRLTSHLFLASFLRSGLRRRPARAVGDRLLQAEPALWMGAGQAVCRRAAPEGHHLGGACVNGIDSHSWLDFQHCGSWCKQAYAGHCVLLLKHELCHQRCRNRCCVSMSPSVFSQDDLEVSLDFFDYFSAMEPLLDSDDKLLAVRCVVACCWCRMLDVSGKNNDVDTTSALLARAAFHSATPAAATIPIFCHCSAWNDMGQSAFASDPRQVYRSDFFPGLGWMLTRHVRTTTAVQRATRY